MKESEEAWSTMLKEVRRIEIEEGRKVPVSKEDWIEIIPSEIKNYFFEEELRELNISELEHLTKLIPSEVEKIMCSISETEDTNASLGPEGYIAAISSALSQILAVKPIIELDETKIKDRLFERLPVFVKEFFSDIWLEKLSNEEIEELLTIPEAELKNVIESLVESGSIKAEPEAKTKSAIEIDFRADLIAELKSELKAGFKIIEGDGSEDAAEIMDIPEPEPDVESEDEKNNDLIDVLDISYEADSEEKPNVESEDESKPEE